MRKVVVTALVACILAACSSINCPVEHTVATKYHIYDANGEDLSLASALTVTTRQSNDTIITLYNLATAMTSFSLPISYSHPEDILFFTFSTALGDSIYGTDTVWVKKEDIPHFESVDCNASFFHRLTDVRYTTHFIDSIVINNPSVTYDQTTIHFRFYPKVDD